MKHEAHKRALKQKDVERLDVLQRAHPGTLTDADRAELEKLQTLRSKYGQK